MIRRSRPLLGTFVELGIVGEPDNNPQVQQALAKAFAAIALIDGLLSFHRPESELSRVNNHPEKWQSVSHHSLRVFTLAKLMGAASGDIFNATVGGAVVKAGALPNPVSHGFLSKGTSADIEISKGSVRLKRPVLVTLDGIAKGYAVDLAVDVLRRRGIASGWVNAGGDLRVFGDAELAVHLRQHNGQLSHKHLIKNAAVASSNIQSQPSSVFPGFIIQPEGEKGLQRETSISVKTRFAWRADALTKVAAGVSVPHRRQIIPLLKGEILDINAKETLGHETL